MNPGVLLYSQIQHSFNLRSNVALPQAVTSSLLLGPADREFLCHSHCALPLAESPGSLKLFD